jgi:alpha-galactosidase
MREEIRISWIKPENLEDHPQLIASTNGFPKRKHRNITLRDSSKEVAVELKEVHSKRGMNQDRDSLNWSKGRRSSHSYRDEAEQSTKERFENENDDQA